MWNPIYNPTIDDKRHIDNFVVASIMHTRKKTGKTGPSRDGHEYHEIWTARKALQLLWPDSVLTAIAIEGLSPTDQAHASTQTIEIADLVLYYGSTVFETASRTSFLQFKYSVASKYVDFRASHAKKTIQKFAKTYCEYLERYGDDAVLDKLDFQLITNQPIYDSLCLAIDAIAHEEACTGDIEKQAIQFKTAAALDGKQLSAFASKFKLYGSSGNLPTIKDELANLLVDWSATHDSIAAARLGQLKNLVRDKAGYAGTNRNLITRTDILAVFQVSYPEDLLPCPSALTDVGEVLDREQLADAIAMIPTLSVPLLVHAAGGVGKTVFLESMAARIAEHCEVLFFDCFGGGAYRSPADARHLPKRGLVHIANTLAFRGFCDPILPDTPDVETLLRTFRRRLVQCISTTRVIKGRELVLFIDAIDNADYAASQHSEDSFPLKLLELLDSEPIPGLKIVVSCRTERKPVTYAHFHELILRPFSINETSAFLKSRFNKVSQVEINVAYARSGGNARVLAYLVENGKSLLEESEIDKKIELDELIQKRISDAIATAIERGYDQNVINAFLAGLAVLPPPVPLEEYAGAHGIELSAIESFASDLFPLLERSNQGLMFKDEPTETFIHNRYASSLPALRRLADNLFARQDVSVYAARALPGLLHELDDGDQLFKLAFDERIPASITSTVGKRNIRYARLKAATLYAAMKADYNHLVRLLLELSTIAVVDQRGSDYILDYPDLVVAAKDVDANRRLFETSTAWPGTRHARLTIANTLSGELQEASRHAIATNEWIDHYRRTDREEGGRKTVPEKPDIAAIPFFLISEGRAPDAVKFLQGWKDWYAYEVCECIFDFSHLAQLLGIQSSDRLMEFVDALADIGPLTAALSFHEFSIPKRKQLLEKLAKLCSDSTNLFLSESYHRKHNSHIEYGLRISSAQAFSLGLEAEALAISLHAPHQRPNIWDFSSPFGHEKVFPFVFRTAIVAEAKKTFIHEKDVLPEKLESICSCISMELEGAEFRDQAKKILSGYIRKQRDEVDETSFPNKISYEDKENAERFIDRYLETLLAFTKAFSSVLAASSVSVNKSFIGLLNSWDDACKNQIPIDQGRFIVFSRCFALMQYCLFLVCVVN
ncbi:MAG: ATP-binding protein [Chlorobium sp.]